MTRDEGRTIIERLVQDFEQQEKYYTSKDFQETEARNRFIDPFFEALGWNFHQTNIAKSEWDVHREFSQKDNSSTKKPDYAFRAKEKNNYKVVFFVEAKAPWVKLTDLDPVYQAKRYAFSSHGKSPIVILTDFQEFRVFNGFQKPIYENPLQGLISGLDIKYTKYLDNWNQIWDLFSKEAVSNGSINRLAGTISKNTKTLDQEFLEDICSWRETLAKNVALRNRDLSVEELNEAVQRIIDRLVFIRNLEDREIESEGTLFSHSKVKEAVYQHLIPLFRNLDSDYNGLLFKKHFSEDLIIDDKVIKDLIKQMCYPLSPYQFDEIEPEILGRIYEKFLGSKIRLTDGHSAKIEEKPEVRHAGGVYYTPQYIVDYIVQNTVGEIILGKNPEEITSITICDPACGSGSFLLGAYGFLMAFHKKWYAEASQQNQKKYKADFYISSENEVKLTLKKRSEILKNNIFGVDIDREATEVAIMSLYLKLLDDGFDKGQVELFMKGHILPDMTGNIKCGNSLVGTDFYGKTLFDDQVNDRINPFDWQSGFKPVFTNGGFDVIVGNPPYIRVQELDYQFIDYCKEKYSTAWKRIDISILFIELANKLLKENGLNGFITSNQFLSTEYGKKARNLLLTNAKIKKMVDFGDLPIFQKALTYVSIFILSKGRTDSFNYYKPLSLEDEINTLKPIEIQAANLNEESWILEDEHNTDLLQKLKSQYPQLKNYAKCWAGLFTGKDDVLMFDKKELDSIEFEHESLLPVIRAQDCGKYCYASPSKYVIYPYKDEKDKTVIIKEKELSELYPKTYSYLKKHKNVLSQRMDSRKEFSENKAWYALTRFGRYSIFHKSKIVSPGEVKNNKFGLDETGSGFSCARVFSITTENENISIYTLLGILNSRIVEYYLHSVAPLKQGGYYSYSSTFIDSVPLPKNILDKGSPDIKELNNYVIALLDCNQKLGNTKMDTEKERLHGKIKYIENEIEGIVYRLYELTKEEIETLNQNQ